MINCAKAHIYLSTESDGELAAGEKAQLEEHLAQCPNCRQMQRELESIKKLIQEKRKIYQPPHQTHFGYLHTYC